MQQSFEVVKFSKLMLSESLENRWVLCESEHITNVVVNVSEFAQYLQLRFIKLLKQVFSYLSRKLSTGYSSGQMSYPNVYYRVTVSAMPFSAQN